MNESLDLNDHVKLDSNVIKSEINKLLELLLKPKNIYDLKEKMEMIYAIINRDCHIDRRMDLIVFDD